MNLASAFEASVNKNQQKTALFWGERTCSYADLWNQSLSVAGKLRKQFKVQKGERVGLWLKNCPEFIPSFFGILQAGAVVVPLNNFLKPAEVNYIIADAGIDVLITDAELGAQFAALAMARPKLKLMQVDAEQGAPETFMAHCNSEPAGASQLAVPLTPRRGSVGCSPGEPESPSEGAKQQRTEGRSVQGPTP